MTVATTTARSAQNGDGSSVTFTVPFYFLNATDLLVYVGGVLKTLTTDYSVSGAGVSTGGSVTFVTAPASGTGNVVIIRDPDQLQSVKYPSNDQFPSGVTETALDKLTMLVQRIRDLIGRSFTLPDSDSSGASLTVPTPESNYLIGWNSTGTGLANYSGSPSTLVSSAMTPVVQATTLALARSAMGLASGATTTVGTAASLDAGTSSGNVPVLNSAGKLAAAVQSALFQPLSAAVATNALTVTLAAGARLDFSDGSTVVLASPISVTVPSGQAVGTSNGVAARLWVVAMKNSGTPELAIINTWNGTDVYEILPTDSISTTAIASAPSAQVWYSTTSRSSQPIAVAGYVEITEATAGTWATAPSNVQGYAPGMPLAGQVIQKRRTASGAMTTGATATPNDDTSPGPVITEGNEFMTLAITPRASVNLLHWRHRGIYANATAATTNVMAFFNTDQHATNAQAVSASVISPGGAGIMTEHGIEYRHIAGVTTATTGRIRCGNAAGTTTTFNGSAGARFHAGLMMSFMEVQEIQR